MLLIVFRSLALSSATDGSGFDSFVACQSRALSRESLSTTKTERPLSCRALARSVASVVLPPPPFGFRIATTVIVHSPE